MIELLLKLEMSLWINETRNNTEYLDKVLHKDFQEFGKNGKIYAKSDILKDTNLDINAVFPFKHLKLKQIDEKTFLITYQSMTVSSGLKTLCNRSSIWIGTESFQMVFHQGTLVSNEVYHG